VTKLVRAMASDKARKIAEALLKKYPTHEETIAEAFEGVRCELMRAKEAHDRAERAYRAEVQS
jgi:ABC-type Zn uptake system ZnuABC Zn-binding protein ZnuA